MKSLLHLLLFLIFSMTGYSQLVLQDMRLEGDVRSEKLALDFWVHNEGADPVTYYWDIDRNANFPSEWGISVCDCWLCYMEGQETANCDMECTTEAQDSFMFTIYVHPHGVEAVGELTFKLLGNCGDDTTLISSNTLTYAVSVGSSTMNSEDSNILIYPNPTLNSFQIAADENIESVVIYDIVGREILVAEHRSGQSYDVSNLEQGIYVVRMMDKASEVVKVVKLTRE